ncbi:hypothetical protein EDD21DRAFT_385041 [Dissophora ornata]|nr:hypothetical protein BGZ58_010231 [Dissophora ornata]KAI8597603.1 hypothetical protein EDD21DRAFT_385041 [Dissophora ornata]
MKVTLCILSTIAAVAYATASTATQGHVYNSYTASSFPIRSSDIQFRSQSNKDAYYSSLKTFNNLITPKEFPDTALPFAVVTPSSANNRGIGRAVKIARDYGFRVSARSGGYQSGYSSNMAAIDSSSQDFVLIDLQKLNQVTINPKDLTATAEPGATGEDLYSQTIKYGLHFPGPHTSRVTLGGFLLQGGMGIGSRYHGAGVDNVLGFDIVLASGRTVYADAKTNSDLFYGVRGGGQFFGVVTKFYLKLTPIVQKPTLVPTYNDTSVKIDQIFAIFDRPQANDLLSFYSGFDPVAPKALENKIIFTVDATTNDKQYLFASVSSVPFNSSSEVTTAQSEITQWYQTVPTNYASSDPTTYAGATRGGDSSWADSDLSYYAEDVWFPVPLDPRLLQVLIDQWDKVPSNLSTMALNTGTWDAPTRSALGYDRSYSFCVYSTWKRNGDPSWDAKNKAWADETLAAIKPWTLGYYANELRPKQLQDQDYWRKCYEENTFDRLSIIKNRWDPSNVFKSLV